MMSLEMGLAVGILLLLVLSAFLAALETVLQRLPLVRALRLNEEEVRGARSLLWLLEHRVTGLNVVLVVTVSARIVLASLFVLLLDDMLAADLGTVLAVVLAIALSLLAGEVVPRTLTLRHLERTGRRLAPLAAPLVRVATPLAAVIVRLGRAVVPARGGISGPYTGDEPADDADADQSDDELEDDERAMIHSVLELGDTIAREIMVPRPDMVTVAEDASRDDLLDIIVRHGFSRVPVHAGRSDEVVGIVYAKDLLRHLATDPRRRWQDLVREPTYVPETKRLDALLRDLQDQTVHLAMVVDEYGDLTGLVTIEDILEEIVGDIIDEHDRAEPLVELLDDERVRVDARLPVDTLNELLGVELPTDGWDSVGGLVFGMLGRVPVVGESIESGGVTLTAERVQGRRVSKVTVAQHGRASISPADAVAADAHAGVDA